MDHAPRSSGSHTKLRCSTHQALVVWVGVPPTFSENPGEFSSPSQNSGSHLPVILGKSGNLRHQTASFAGAPIMTRERCHVTQPRARINVRCSRAGHKGALRDGGTTKGPRKDGSKGQRRTANETAKSQRLAHRSHTAGDDRGTSGTNRKAWAPERPKGNKHEIPMREARLSDFISKFC